MASFMVEAEAERLLALGEELFEDEIFKVADREVLGRIGFVRTMVPGPTYGEARAVAVAHLRERGRTEGFTLDGIFGAKGVPLTGGTTLFIFIGEMGQG